MIRRSRVAPLRMRLVSLLVSTAAVGCAGSAGTVAPPSPTATGSAQALTAPALKLRVLAAVGGRIDWCDPDMYPVARGTELHNARAHIDQIQQDASTYAAILAFEHIPPSQPLTDDELVRVYEDYKLVAHEDPIPLEAATGGYRFTVVVLNAGSGYDDQVQGTVSPEGHVAIDQVVHGGGDHNFRPNCPICLARGVLIATPDGPVAVQDVRVGMAVWTVDRAGRRVPAVVVRTRRLAADGEVLRVTLADGRTVVVSPRHPTAGGRPIGDLLPGDPLSGSTVESITPIAYRGFTYDLLPSGPTGTYFADGVLLGSTLRRR
jgi:Hint domain